MWHVDTAQTNLGPHSRRVSLCCPLLAVLSFPTKMSAIDTFHWVSFTLLTAWAQRCRDGTSRQETGSSSKEGKGLFPSAATHVVNYFKYVHKDSKFAISIQIFKTFVSSLKDHFQLAVRRLHSTVLQ